MSSFYRKPEPANECGFSLVELAVAAGLAVALGAATVFVLTGAGDAMKANSTQAASDADDYNQEVLGLYDDAMGSEDEAVSSGGGTGGGTGGGSGWAPVAGSESETALAGVNVASWAVGSGYGAWSPSTPAVLVDYTNGEYYFLPASNIGLNAQGLLPQGQVSKQKSTFLGYGFTVTEETPYLLIMSKTENWGGYYEYKWDFTDPTIYVTDTVQNTNIFGRSAYMHLDADGNLLPMR